MRHHAAWYCPYTRAARDFLSNYISQSNNVVIFRLSIGEEGGAGRQALLCDDQFSAGWGISRPYTDECALHGLAFIFFAINGAGGNLVVSEAD
jgi:hypothetical protein